MALIYEEKGDLENALKTYKEALEIFKESSQSNNLPSIATILHNIGNVNRVMGKFEKASQNYTDALSICKKIYPPDHPKIGETLNNMGLIYQEKGDFEFALQNYSDALHIFKKSYHAIIHR